ncbi:MAG: hypothetical protein QXE94_01695 [Candidatus Bathyarchaeia archaeon]
MPPILKPTGSFIGGMYDIHDYFKRVENARRRLGSLPYSELLLNFIDHLQALGLSKGEVCHRLCTLFKACPFDPAKPRGKALNRLLRG